MEQDGPVLRLPVNPAEISFQREKLFETVNIMSLGEVDFPSNGEKVQETTFSSFFPAEYDASYCQFSSIPDPEEAMAQLEAWTKSQKPIHFIVGGTKINKLVMASAHTLTIKGGEPGDIYFELTLRSWREIKVRTVAELQRTASGIIANRPDLKPVPKTYTVKLGDSLFAIAKMQLGDGSRWKELFALNSSIIGKKPELIYAGTKLVMPA